MAFKIDLNNVYDRIEWDFLCDIRTKMGFNDRWVGLLFQCISMVRLSVVVNGFMRIGIQQSDPLSPHLFICIQDVLSSLICQAINSNEFQGINI